MPADSLYAIPSFALGSAAYALLLVQVVVVKGSTIRSRVMLAAVAATLGWQLLVLTAALQQSQKVQAVAGAFDAFQAALWLAVLARTLVGLGSSFETLRRSRPALFLLMGTTVLAGLVAAFQLQIGFFESHRDEGVGRAVISAWLGLSIAGLALVEQVYRNTPVAFRWAIKPMCIGLGSAFAFDLYCYSEAFLYGTLDPVISSARGLVHGLTVPFVALSIARTRGWKASLTLSRQFVFHSTAFLTSGLYLLGVAAGGYYLRAFGGDWAEFFQVTFVFGAVLVLVVLFWSGTIRSKIRVWVSKHFFSYRFDYREEWLSFTRALSQPNSDVDIYERSVRALTDLVESPGGGIWLLRNGRWKQVARWSMPQVSVDEPVDGSLPAFLTQKGWVLDVNEAKLRGAEYNNVALPEWLTALPDAWIVAPLMISESELFGFVVFMTPRSGAELNWEVLDLLKTAGRQCASFLAQIEANEALLESRKFDAFNRLSAFVVHDLKNLVAQLSLLRKNAERHWRRMNDMLLQLRSGTTPVEQPRPVELRRALDRVVATKAAQKHRIAVDGASPDITVLGHEDRLERVVGHLVQNALDASVNESMVRIEVSQNRDEVRISVMDSGVGMTPEYVRDKLFRPFQSTKDTGMGIGTFESHQYVTSIGGQMLVDSVPGKGTTITVKLPAARSNRVQQELV